MDIGNLGQRAAIILSLLAVVAAIGKPFTNKAKLEAKIDSTVKECKIKNDADNDLMRRDIKFLTKENEKLWERVNTHEDRLSTTDVVLGKLVVRFDAVESLLQRIDKKLP